MKNLLFFAALVCFSAPARELVDCIVARVNDVNICDSELREPQLMLGGQVRSLEQCVVDEILLQKAKTSGVMPAQEEVEKKVIAYRQGNGFGYKTNDDYEHFLKTAGLSMKKVAKQIKKSTASVRMESLLMPRSAVVDRSEIEAYCTQNPQEKEAAYLISFATGSKDLVSEDGQLQDRAVLHWSKFDGWLNESDLSKSMKFIVSMKPGEVSSPVVRGDSFFIYRLEDFEKSRPLTVDERLNEVERMLIEDAKKEKFVDIKKRLREEACVVYVPA